MDYGRSLLYKIYVIIRRKLLQLYLLVWRTSFTFYLSYRIPVLIDQYFEQLRWMIFVAKLQHKVYNM